MRAEPHLRRAVRTVIRIHQEREEALRRALKSGDPAEVVRCVRGQLGLEDGEEADRAPESE